VTCRAAPLAPMMRSDMDHLAAVRTRGRPSRRTKPSHREADPAAAGRHRVRVLHLERLPHQVVDEVELRAAHIFEADGVDEDGRAVAGHDEVILGPRLLDVERILKTRAAAALD